MEEAALDWKQEIFKRLDAMAEKLGVAAQYLWGVVVKQAYVEGITDLIVTVVLAIAATIAIKLCIKWHYKIIEDRWDDISYLPFTFAVIGIVVLLGIALGNLVDGVQHIANPAYFALKLLGEAISGK